VWQSGHLDSSNIANSFCSINMLISTEVLILGLEEVIDTAWVGLFLSCRESSCVRDGYTDHCDFLTG
jgi:hypothetical protein